MIQKELFSACWQCLVTKSAEAKLDCVQQLVAHWQLRQLSLDHDAPCKQLAQAGIPEAVRLVHPSKVARRRLGSREGRIALLHAVAHIEFSAINLALDAVYRFRNLPENYYSDWLRVAAEECYHFRLISGQLKQMGASYGVLAAHNGLWEVAVYSAGDVLTRMALVPRVLEARGLDVTPGMIRRVDDVGDHSFADILRIIFRDEVRHVRTGSQWFRYVCRERGLDSDISFDRILRKYMADLNANVSGPFQTEARIKAGFSKTEMDNLKHEAY
jgi:uncharacterized ferritin-like protein (DUF455 family)